MLLGTVFAICFFSFWDLGHNEKIDLRQLKYTAQNFSKGEETLHSEVAETQYFVPQCENSTDNGKGEAEKDRAESECFVYHRTQQA